MAVMAAFAAWKAIGHALYGQRVSAPDRQVAKGRLAMTGVVDLSGEPATAEQEFFASFLQKRRPCLGFP
jgi:hypothetical protein